VKGIGHQVRVHFAGLPASFNTWCSAKELRRRYGVVVDEFIRGQEQSCDAATPVAPGPATSARKRARKSASSTELEPQPEDASSAAGALAVPTLPSSAAAAAELAVAPLLASPALAPASAGTGPLSAPFEQTSSLELAASSSAQPLPECGATE
jgi:hypothetical protein